MPYQWITWVQARQALASRLADPSNAFWTDTENGLYLAESLRTFNALTEVWNADFAFQANPASQWYSLAVMPGSPRLRTLTDAYLYTVMQYHLLEPPSGGGAWTGTSQFTLADLRFSLQRRRDEMVQASGSNLWPITLPSAPGNRRTTFPDSSLEPRRARFIPAAAFGSPVTLSREDTLAFDVFQTGHLQSSLLPTAWSVISGPPLMMDMDNAPNVPGYYELISLQSGIPFNPPAPTLLGVPDDWAWLAKWGALSDLLGRESEATDRQRADYCLKRYLDGLRVMRASNWLLTATINGVSVDTPSVKEMDGFSPEWENNAVAWPSLVTAGMDLCGPCPVSTGSYVGVSCVLVGNAPVPTADNQFVQVSRDVFDVILDYAQTIACFKMGGEEFAATKDLEKNFFAAAVATNKRLADMALFRDVLGSEGQRQNIQQPRG